jgi:hypothetical protein
MVGQRHLARHRPVAPTDPPRVRNGVVGGAARAHGDQGRAIAGAAGDAMDARGLQGFGEAPRGQDGGQPARPPRRPHPRWTEEEDVMVTIPACTSASRTPLRCRRPFAVAQDQAAREPDGMSHDLGWASMMCVDGG